MANDTRIPTNLRTLLILEAFGKMPGPVSPTELARQLGLSKQTMHRLCNTLLEEGFLVRDDSQKGLRPGRRLRMMASTVLNSSSSHVARHQVLANLASKVRESVNFVVPEDRGMIYQDRVETDWPFRIQLPVGTHVPFYCTASGKVYMASLPKAERSRLVNVMQITPNTKNTITDPKAMLAELAQIAKDGYGLDREEFIEGMIAIAVPVFDLAGRYTASLAFHGPIQRITIEDAISMKQLMFDASAQLTEVIFGQPKTIKE